MKGWRIVPVLVLVGLLAAPTRIGFGVAAQEPAATGQARPATAWRVGLQIGHLRVEELPEDQARLRGQTGGSGGSYPRWTSTRRSCCARRRF